MVKIVYNPGSGDVTLTSVRGPNNFQCAYRSRVHDNLATSGFRERVFEASDMVISFTMPAMVVDGDLPDWCAFMTFALAGGQFDFYPNSALSDHYHCVSEDEGFAPARVAPARYSASFRFQIVPDDHAPGDPAYVLQKFYGV